MTPLDLIVPGAALVTGLGFGAVAIYIDRPGPGQRAAPRGEAGHTNSGAAAAAIGRAWRKARRVLAMARDGEPRCPACQCATGALCGHACCGRHLAAPRYEQAAPPAAPPPPGAETAKWVRTGQRPASWPGTLTAADLFAALPHGARTGVWQPREMPARRSWLPATPQNQGAPDVDDLDDTGIMAALTHWAATAPIRDIKAALAEGHAR